MAAIRIRHLLGASLSSCLATLAGSRSLPAQAPADPGNRIPVRIMWDQKVAMRDGVRLSATVYRDPKRTEQVPAIVVLTPYIADHAAKQGTYFAQNGYVFVAVDARGRGNSEGEFRPGCCEARDGHDTIE